jgi:hypothetical protein
MKEDFEEYLGRQSLRPIPPQWRAQILRAAQTPRAGPAPVPWWQEWLWPYPRAWAGLAAIWAMTLALNFASGEPTPLACKTSSSPETLIALREQQQTLAKLIAPAAYPETEPPKPLPPRRSQLRPIVLTA